MNNGEIAELAAFLRDYEVRTNGHCFDDLAPLIAEDATYWFGDGSFTGREAVSHAIEATWDPIRDERYEIEDVRWIAVCLYTFHWEGLVDGILREGRGRGTSVLRQDAEGWQVIHEHPSPMPVEVPASQ
jgi:ketosteroid isomerase-like protein